MTLKPINEAVVYSVYRKLFGNGLTVKIPLLLLVLSGCAAAPIKPPAAELDKIRAVLVVPVESPPLEAIPDPLEARMPVYGHFKNMALPLFLEENIYRNPGGILIAGLMGDDDVVPAVTFERGLGAGLKPIPGASENWTPTFVLAREAASQLNAARIKAIPSDRYYRLRMEDRDAYLDHWHTAVEQWYEQDSSTVDYQAMGPADAVLELGIGTYKIFANQAALQVLIKLIDPSTGRVIARTSRQAFSAEDSAQTLLSREGEAFKELIAETGARLLGQAFGDMGLAQKNWLRQTGRTGVPDGSNGLSRGRAVIP